MQHLANRQDRTWYFSSYLHLCISKKHSRWWIHYSYYIPKRKFVYHKPSANFEEFFQDMDTTPCVTAMIAPRETVMEILKEANGVLHYEVVASKLAEALQRAQPETGEAGDLKLLALASIPLDFCNETDPFVRYPAESSKKRKAEAMDIIFTTLGEIVLTKFPGCLWAGPGLEKMFGLCRVLIEATADPHDLRTTATNHCNVLIHLVIPRSSQEQRSIYRWSSSEDGVACRAIRATQFQLTVAPPILRFLQGLGRKKRDGPDLPSCVSCGGALAARSGRC